MKYNIGIIGRGFVGGAIESYLRECSQHQVVSYDLTDDTDINISYKAIVTQSDIIYVCLPTPMDEDGSCYIDIIDAALDLLNHYAREIDKTPIVLIKSTMVPGSSDNFQAKYNNLLIVPNPEFLTERTAKEDVKCTQRHLLGCPTDVETALPLLATLTTYHENTWPNAEIVFARKIEAEMIKYMTNSFFAVKVTFANHMYNLCQSLGVNYNSFIEVAIEADPRLGELHWQVPGHTGELGYSKKCFPKDLSGMIELFKSQGLEPSLLECTRSFNNRQRGLNHE